MAQYKIPDPEELTPCPYDKVHMIRAKRMQYHLMKCRKNYAGRDFATCPFNARHEMPKPELRYHLANCPDKALIEPMLAYENSKKNGEEGSMFKGNTDLPVYENLNINSEENWDAEIPSVARIGVDPQFLAKQDHMIIPGLTKSEKREFVKQMNIPAEDRKYVAHYTETREEDLTLKDEQPKLRLPKTAAQTYLPHQRKSFQQPSTVFAYSLSMAGVGRGLPVTGAEGGAQNERPGLSRGRGRGFTPAMGRGATIAEMNGHVPQSIGRGMAYYNGDAPSTIQKSSAAVKPEVLSTTPVFNVGIGRGVPNGLYTVVILKCLLAHLSPRCRRAFLIKICPLLLALLLTFHIFIFLSRTTWSISIKLGTDHPFVKGIQVCSNEGPCPLQRGDNYKNRVWSFKEPLDQKS
ncbi:uncharacterized protein LOC125683191 isoform X1 [Ostrea edulis]|uniref:uncharacterized protein LOC125683191 isoform X1 n=1 Tax=Ostrea edulis TaxID=37623 RepID=UPI0024AED139|nr:uncharacterized protein LOC125683191 isoform X1 [Ostrea edulis]